MFWVVPRFRSTAVSLVAVALTTVLFSRVIPVNPTTAAMAYLLVILFVGAVATLSEGIIASVAAMLTFNYFFLPPIGKFTIADPQNWIALFAFLTVALVSSKLSMNFRRQQEELITSRLEIERLYALSRSMLLGDSGGEVRRLIVNKVIELFEFSEAALFEASSGIVQRSNAKGVIPEERLRQASVRGAVEYDEPRHMTLVPITLGGSHLGALGYCGARLGEGNLQALANTIAIGLAQSEAREAHSRAEAVRKSEELKSVLIDALAHDLKTPLTAIDAAADLLLRPDLVSNDQRRDLLAVIREEVTGLKRIMEEAIHLARLDAKRIRLDHEEIGIPDLVASTLATLGQQTADRRIELEMPGQMAPVHADRELMTQALKQLIDNALKYSPANSTITISASEADGMISIAVHNQGDGLTSIEQGRVFDKFYRARNDTLGVQGSGMGLAIAKEIVEAHGGSIRVESNPGEGSRFTISLAASRTPAVAEHQQA
jgi:two-component system, OmpR family, sensor histidine kinase KdpD